MKKRAKSDSSTPNPPTITTTVTRRPALYDVPLDILIFILKFVAIKELCRLLRLSSYFRECCEKILASLTHIEFPDPKNRAMDVEARVLTVEKYCKNLRTVAFNGQSTKYHQYISKTNRLSVAFRNTSSSRLSVATTDLRSVQNLTDLQLCYNRIPVIVDVFRTNHIQTFMIRRFTFDTNIYDAMKLLPFTGSLHTFHWGGQEPPRTFLKCLAEQAPNLTSLEVMLKSDIVSELEFFPKLLFLDLTYTGDTHVYAELKCCSKLTELKLRTNEAWQCSTSNIQSLNKFTFESTSTIHYNHSVMNCHVAQRILTSLPNIQDMVLGCCVLNDIVEQMSSTGASAPSVTYLRWSARKCSLHRCPTLPRNVHEVFPNLCHFEFPTINSGTLVHLYESGVDLRTLKCGKIAGEAFSGSFGARKFAFLQALPNDPNIFKNFELFRIESSSMNNTGRFLMNCVRPNRPKLVAFCVGTVDVTGN